jgi:hypothetical protein
MLSAWGCRETATDRHDGLKYFHDGPLETDIHVDTPRARQGRRTAKLTPEIATAGRS